jgi:hypothetical protein
MAILSALLILSCGVAQVGGADDETDSDRSMQSFSIGQAVEVCSTGGVGLRQRSGPSTSYSVLQVIDEGEELTILARSGSWYKATFDGHTGWSHGKYLCATSTVSPVDPGVPDPTPSPGSPSSATWSCNGSYGKLKAQSGDYFVTSFGCWVDSSGNAHGDSGDNCLPACLSQARAAGLCKSSWSGKTCEQQLNWYTADSGRFGCLQRLRITNPSNGKQVIAITLDAGPACWVEAKVSKEILDVSGAVATYLFGTTAIGPTERKLVHVVEVGSSVPLGPVP